MKDSKNPEERFRDKARLVIKVNYFSSLFSLLFGAVCFYVLDITYVIPYVFLIFGLLNLANTLLFRYHGNLTFTYNIVSIMTLAGATIITLYSGGINSPFIFV
ncbi:MAG TPA: sensor histidine kinase, partial [Pricia sp.]|nr:sensor histidine kinase [Pricia sp.]